MSRREWYTYIYIPSRSQGIRLLRCLASPLRRRVVQGLDVRAPLLLVGADDSSVVGEEAVDFSFDVGGLTVRGVS